MKKVISTAEAGKLINDGASVMVGGFIQCGVPKRVVNELAETGTKNLTLISIDTSFADADRGRLVANKQLKKAIVSHIGLNPETGNRMQSGDLEVELVPMGTLVERIRAAGAGLGGVLTPTGVGTIVEEGKDVIEVDNKKYLLEKPIHADFAIIYGTKVDKHGNVAFFGSTRNSNTVMATAAKTVIVEADELVDCLDPNEVVIPGLFVDYIAL
ncbi:MAG: CoA transferase subunit A [Lactobacillus sp.]|nr:CoA transferase subunit A [Lactobacillus sp.]